MVRGKLFIISGPSGSGKSTILEELLRRFPEAGKLTTYTTREPRGGEIPGKDYFFISRPEFERLKAEGFFLEWAKTYGILHGSPKREFFRLLQERQIVFAVLDIKGVQAVLEKVPDAVTLFIQPGSFEEIQARLRRRGSSVADVSLRGEAAEEECKSARFFHHTIENQEGEVVKTVEAVAAIIRSYL